MAIAPKVTSIRVTHSDGTILAADGDAANHLWRTICGALNLHAIRTGKRYTGPNFRVIEGSPISDEPIKLPAETPTAQELADTSGEEMLQNLRANAAEESAVAAPPA
jgi:hypothetical protein